MPIYEYRCTKCGDIKEVIQKVCTPAPFCNCGGKVIKIIPTCTHFNLKGEDWAAGGFH